MTRSLMYKEALQAFSEEILSEKNNEKLTDNMKVAEQEFLKRGLEILTTPEESGLIELMWAYKVLLNE